MMMHERTRKKGGGWNHVMKGSLPLKGVATWRRPPAPPVRLFGGGPGGPFSSSLVRTVRAVLKLEREKEREEVRRKGERKSVEEMANPPSVRVIVERLGCSAPAGIQGNEINDRTTG